MCNKWVHLKCTNVTWTQFEHLSKNLNVPYYCVKCKPNIPQVPPNHSTYSTPNSSLNNSTLLSTNLDSSSAQSSDFEFVTDESDSESRGLNFDCLPKCNTTKSRKNPNSSNSCRQKHFSLSTRTYKYPCVACYGPCKLKCQDSICCTICDEWTHQKCSNLSINEFQKYCLPENSEWPFYCETCMNGSNKNRDNQICLNASEINLLDTNDIYNLCPNSIFSDKDDIATTEYFTTCELNVEIKKKS